MCTNELKIVQLDNDFPCYLLSPSSIFNKELKKFKEKTELILKYAAKIFQITQEDKDKTNANNNQKRKKKKNSSLILVS